MSKLDKKSEELFKALMESLKKERESIGSLQQAELAKELECTKGYLNKFENGKVFPSSINMLIKYLLVNQFNINPVLNLKIKSSDKEIDEKRKKLIKRIKEMDDNKLLYMDEVSKIANIFNLSSSNNMKNS